ncbi:MAG: hypothetical protein A2Z34_08915 [Planctomycetes bacterium RBG_16_59_8]|nr:MAG: hypothetical protein A2Z34_08915 [Planctomycetes bacterium RBG_16_59_8]
MRLLHQLGRSGGTIISKCLAVMKDVVLLSEIHPDWRRLGYRTDKQADMWCSPIHQASRWYGLFDAAEVDEVMRRDDHLAFSDIIGSIADRCARQNRILVIRVFDTVDFLPGAYLASPPFRSTTTLELERELSLIEASTVRHPADVWASNLQFVPHKERLNPDGHLTGYRAFAELAHKTGFVRYEDFTADPEESLATLCRLLRIPYDHGWRERWQSYDRLTGDPVAIAPGYEIRPHPPKYLSTQDVELFRENHDCRRALELLGYDPM